jgi:hypothetical protein
MKGDGGEIGRAEFPLSSTNADDGSMTCQDTQKNYRGIKEFKPLLILTTAASIFYRGDVLLFP